MPDFGGGTGEQFGPLTTVGAVGPAGPTGPTGLGAISSTSLLASVTINSTPTQILSLALGAGTYFVSGPLTVTTTSGVTAYVGDAWLGSSSATIINCIGTQSFGLSNDVSADPYGAAHPAGQITFASSGTVFLNGQVNGGTLVKAATVGPVSGATMATQIIAILI